MHRYKQTDPMLIPYRDIIEANYNDNELNCGGRDVSYQFHFHLLSITQVYFIVYV